MQTPPGRHALASAALLILVAATSATPAAEAAPTSVATTVDVDVRADLATVPETALGVNHAIWDAELRAQPPARCCPRTR